MVIVYAQNGDVAADSRAREDAARRYPGVKASGRNPQFYGAATAAPVRDATAVYVRAYWGRIVADYRAMGVTVHVLEELPPFAPVRPAESPTAPTAPAPFMGDPAPRGARPPRGQR